MITVMAKITSVEQLQSKWPTFAAFARDVGVEWGTAQQWRLRGSIPPKYWPAIVAAADDNKIKGVTVEALLAMRTKQDEAA